MPLLYKSLVTICGCSCPSERYDMILFLSSSVLPFFRPSHQLSSPFISVNLAYDTPYRYPHTDIWYGDCYIDCYDIVFFGFLSVIFVNPPTLPTHLFTTYDIMFIMS